MFVYALSIRFDLEEYLTAIEAAGSNPSVTRNHSRSFQNVDVELSFTKVDMLKCELLNFIIYSN